ncbi:MAG TPA: flavin reductase family protein [Gemmatimonadaceae bacterium]|jgi:flavin reductase (DIM6/NTAB) family NADH-FMN oxidoreductase RutF
MSLDPDSFRAVLGRFAAGVTVVTALGDDGRDAGMTVTAFCSLSLEPTLILVCIAHDASLHPLLREGTPFAVNILAAGQEALSRRFSGPDPNRFDGVGYTRGRTGVALLDDVLAWVECRVVHLYPGGDHTICVGQVESGEVRPERPLLYYRGGYAQLER